MNNPKVSIIIPVFNTEAYVEQTVRTIMAQTLRDIEIILVNDGSTDRSAAILDQLAGEDTRITVYTQVNKGLSEARNIGIDRAQGEFIYFMDSDDLLEADTLECCYDRSMKDNLDFVFFDAESFGENVKIEAWYDYQRARYFKKDHYRGADLLQEMFDRNCYRASACLSFIRLSYLRGLGLRFFPGILHEDELFTLQLYLQSERIGGIDRSFFHRRLRGGSIMASNFSMRNLDGYMTVIRELTHFAAKQNAKGRKLVVHMTKILLRNVLRRAWELPFSVRWQLSGTVLRNYRREVDFKSLLILLFKKPIKR